MGVCSGEVKFESLAAWQQRCAKKLFGGRSKAFIRSAILVPRLCHSRSQALPGNVLPARLCLASVRQARQSLTSSTFPGGAREREKRLFSFPGSARERVARQALPAFYYSRSQALPGNVLPARLCLASVRQA